MGQNLALGISRTTASKSPSSATRRKKTDKFVADNPRNTPGGLVGTKALQEFVQSWRSPARWSILVQAGTRNRRWRSTTLTMLLEKGDIVVDGGQRALDRHHPARKSAGDRIRAGGQRCVPAAKRAPRFGPSLMPGGNLRRLAGDSSPFGKPVQRPRWTKRPASLSPNFAAEKPYPGRRALHRLHRRENGAGHYVKKWCTTGIQYGGACR